MKPLLQLATGLCLSLALACAQAQTCANPLTINSTVASSWLPYDSCSSFNYLDTNWQGIVYTPGRDVVYLVKPVSLTQKFVGGLHFTLFPQQSTYDPAIFACSQCGAAALCIDGRDDGGPGYTEQMSIAAQHHTYYLIVDSTESTYPSNCGPYVLNVVKN